MQGTERELDVPDIKYLLTKNAILLIYILVIFIGVFAVTFYLNSSFTPNSFNVTSDTQIVVLNEKNDRTVLLTINVKSLNGKAVIKYYDFDIWSEIPLSVGVHRFVLNTYNISIIFSQGTQFQGDFSAKIIGNGSFEEFVTTLVFIFMAIPASLLLLISFFRKKFSSFTLLTFLSLHLMLLLEFYNISTPVYPLIDSFLTIISGLLYGFIYLVIIFVIFQFFFFRTSKFFTSTEILLVQAMGLISILFSALLIVNSGIFIFANQVIFLKLWVALYYLLLGLIAFKKSEFFRLQSEINGIPAKKVYSH